jgi:hypothetical protein
VRAAGAVVLVIGLAAFGVLAWALRKVVLLGRPFDPGDFVVFGVLAIFGGFCLWLAWQLIHARVDSPPQSAPSASPPRRVTLSHGCSTVGVLLLMLSVLVPAHWHPVALLFAGLAFLAVAHALTPCEERLEKLRKARASLRQL